MRRAARVDRNHSEIVRAFQQAGFAVLDIHQLKNCCDLFVSRNGQTWAIEIKDGTKAPSKRRLTSGEAKFFARWKGKTAIVECVDDVITLARKGNGDIERG